MRIDMHCHAIGKGLDIDKIDTRVYFNPGDNQHWFTRILYSLVESDLVRMKADMDRDGAVSTDEYFDLIFKLLADSQEIDGIVLLGLDAVYNPDDGKLNKKKTDLWISNRFLSARIKALNSRLHAEGKSGKCFYLGASVNPNNAKWESELDFVLNETSAVLVKMIPSVQHVDLSDIKKHKTFYKALVSSGLPLLCHVGPEYAFPEGIRKTKLDFFKRLEKPLECGVCVIAAHCATPVFPLVDRNFIKEFASFMEKVNKGKIQLWADTSALSLSTRVPFMQEILDTFSPDWLLHGSDFPIPVDGWAHLPFFTNRISPDEYIRICRTKNPLDRDVRIKRGLGFPDSILERAQSVLPVGR